MSRIIQKIIPHSTATKLFMGITAFQSLVIIAMEAVIVSKGQILHNAFTSKSPDERRVLPVYLGIFVLATIFQLALAIDAIANRNTIQIIGLNIFQLMSLLYGVIQISEIRSAFDSIGVTNDTSITVLLDVIPIMLAITFIVYVPLTWQIFKEFGWEIFKSLGADRKIKKVFAAYQVFVTHLKFDYFFFIAFSLQFVLLVLKQDDIEKWLTLGAVPITLGLLVLGHFAVRKENKILMIFFMLMLVVGAGYFSFKIFRIFQNTNGAYTLVAKSLTIFSVLSLVLVTSTFGCSCICYRNFDAGLRYHLVRSTRRTKFQEAGLDSEAVGLHYQLGSAASSSRMTID